VTKPQIGDQLPVLLEVRTPDVIQQTTTLTDHLQQAASRVVILVMRAEMTRQMIDPRGQKRDLNARGAAVPLVELELLNDFFAIERHVDLFASSRDYAT
jgi:hypothetical protein